MELFKHKNGTHIEINDSQLYFEECGLTDGFPLLFLHGGLGSIEDYSHFVGLFCSEFRCIGIDSRGHGKSEIGNQALTYEVLENDVEAILNELGISKCHVIGFSDGGIIAYRLSIKKPSLFSKIVTIGSDYNPPNGDLLEKFNSITVDSWEKRSPESVDAYNKISPDKNFENLLKNTVNMWTDLGPSGYPGELVRKIESPIMIARGHHDYLMPKNGFDLVSKDIPNAEIFNIPMAGHMAHVDQSNLVEIAIKRFFSL